PVAIAAVPVTAIAIAIAKPDTAVPAARIAVAQAAVRCAIDVLRAGLAVVVVATAATICVITHATRQQQRRRDGNELDASHVMPLFMRMAASPRGIESVLNPPVLPDQPERRGFRCAGRAIPAHRMRRGRRFG